MQKGFYDLTSGMLTQNRILNNVSTNLTNVSTPGYKRDELMTKTFDERMQVRTGNIDKSFAEELHDASMLRTVDEVYTVFSQGSFDETGRDLDFAIFGDAFFEVQTEDGGLLYTRNGSFTLDPEGRLWLQNVGLVMGSDDQPITLSTDRIECDEDGNITDRQKNPLGALKLVRFNDNNLLLKTDEGMFANPDEGNISEEDDSKVYNRRLENSNADLMEVMTQMITAERAFQSASQVLKMLDESLSLTVTEISKFD